MNLDVFTAQDEKAKAKAAFGLLLDRLEAEQDKLQDAEQSKLKTAADIRRWQLKQRRNLGELLGPFPERTPLRCKTTGVMERGRVRIEKLIFESRPRYYVTANLYVPLDVPLPAPGVVVTCGHVGAGKGCRMYREAAMGLALQGFVALIFDPTGEGERSECYDPDTGRHWVQREVSQHHWTGKPCFLTGTTLVGHRIWDGIRCLDLMCERQEVDSKRLAVMGNSGGGIMAMLITAADPRVVACAAGHPGGSCEGMHLRGTVMRDRVLLPLIAPRPCRIIVGDASGEAERHGAKIKIMQPFYELLGCPERLELVLVNGVHDLKKPKREACYPWLARWLGMPEPKPTEPPMRTPSIRALWCTADGQVRSSLGGETMQSLNRARAREVTARRKLPAGQGTAKIHADLNRFRQAMAQRIGFVGCDGPLQVRTVCTETVAKGTIERLVLESEPGMPVPALFFNPVAPRSAAQVVVHVAENGKPGTLDSRSLPVRLWKAGIPVLSIDVRDTGETSIGPLDDPHDKLHQRARNRRNFSMARWRHDTLAIRAMGLGRTLSAMRVLDILKAVDLLKSRDDLRGLPIAVVGEGRGAIWALKAAALDSRIAAVVCLRMLASYRMLTDHPDYNQLHHFWVPGALLDYDLCELPALCAPRPVSILDPIDQMSEGLALSKANSLFHVAQGVYGQLGCGENLTITRDAGTASILACLAKGVSGRVRP